MDLGLVLYILFQIMNQQISLFHRALNIFMYFNEINTID